MARRSPFRGASRLKKSKRPIDYLCESLEPRTLFVVLHGGDVFEFFAENSFYERVVVTGNTTVELIGGRDDPTAPSVATQFSLNKMQGVLNGMPVNGGFVNAMMMGGMTPVAFSDTIYAMYVSQSDVNSRIAVAMVPDLMASPRPMEPYTGTVGTLRVIPTASSAAQPPPPMYTVTIPDGTGMALLGARTITPMPPMGGQAPMNVDNVPILSAPVPAGMFTTLPSSITTLAPGLIVAPGNNLAAFLFGGTVTGQVNIHGSIDQFYAGCLLTGNADGEADLGIVSFPQNFNVDGELRNLIVNGPIGTNTDVYTLPGIPQYVTGFDIHVGGRVGQIVTGDSLVGAVDVTNSPSAANLDALPQNEIEFRGPATGFDPWDAAMLGGNGIPVLLNDTFDSPQYLAVDSSGTATVNGVLQTQPDIPPAPAGDYSDYYAVPLMAGQTVTVQVAGLGVDVGVFDPDRRLIATDYNRVDLSQTENQPFQFTADRPGVYRFAVSQTVDNNFDAAPPPGQGFAFSDFAYTLQLTGLGNLAISGLVAANNILDNPSGLVVSRARGNNFFGLVTGFHVANGDFGAAVAGAFGTAQAEHTGEVISDDAGLAGTLSLTGQVVRQFTFGVDNGNLRTVQGYQLGDFVALGQRTVGVGSQPSGTGGTRVVSQLAADSGAVFNFPPTADVPHGSVGLLSATGVSTGITGDHFVLGWNIFVGDGIELSPSAAAQSAIGGDYQVVSSNDILAADLVANGNIGTIRAVDMATSPASYFQVNASNNPNVHGTIDLIDCRAWFGDLSDGGPGITTGPGGNVRYIHTGSFGVVYRDLFFGGGQPELTAFQPGESADITDDSGTLIHITPVGGLAATNFNPANPVFTTPAQLFVTTYPIRGSGGSVVVRVESTDSVSITADGAGKGQSAEIGTIVLDGLGTAVVNNNTIQPNNNPGAGTGGGTTTTTTTTGTGTASRRHQRGHARPPHRGRPHPAPSHRRNTRRQPFPGPGQPGGPPPAGGATGVVGSPGGLPAPTGNGQKFTPPRLPNPPTLPPGVPLTVSLAGNVRLDTFEIATTVDPAGGMGGSNLDESLLKGQGNVTSITNSTPGEIVNIHVPSLGTVTTNGSLGLVQSHTASAVLGLIKNPLMEDMGSLTNPWDYPFLQPRTTIRVLGNIVSISADRGVANLYAGFIFINGTGDFNLNSGPGVSMPPPPFPGTPEAPISRLPITNGLQGNIGSVSAHILGPVVAAGSIGSVTARQGTGGNGSGAVGGAGIYAFGVIGPVVSNGDFHGTIISLTAQMGLTVNGVLDQAVVSNYIRFDFAESRVFGTIIPTNPFGTNPITFPTLDLGAINVNGNGGIIGTLVEADHIGPITVADSGFGIFDSRFDVLGEGTMAGFTTGGYGIRITTLSGGASVGPISVHGNGATLPTTGFPASVRLSETGAIFDPVTGLPLSLLNDIDTYLGTISGPHAVPGVSDSGVIEDSFVLGSRDLSSVSAWSIRGRNLNGLGFPDPNFRPVFTAQATSLNFGNRIGFLNVTGPIRGLNMTTGRGFRYKFNGDVSGLNMTVAGPLQNVIFNNSLLSDSFINATGPNGRIGTLIIHGSLDGGVRAQQRIGRIQVDGNLVGNVTAPFLNMLKLGGGVGNGSLTINTSVGTIQTVGDFGVAGSSLTINGSLGALKVGGNLNGMLTVEHNLKDLNVNGSILTGAKVAVGGTLSLLKVGGDVQAGAIVHAQIIKKQVVKGRVLGTIIAP